MYLAFMPRSPTNLVPSQTSMTPFTWAEYSKMHPFAPLDQAQGYKEMMEVRSCDSSQHRTSQQQLTLLSSPTCRSSLKTSAP